MHEHRYRVSFATCQLFRLYTLHSAETSPRAVRSLPQICPRPVLACGSCSCITAYAVINQPKVRAVERPHVGSHEFHDDVWRARWSCERYKLNQRCFGCLAWSVRLDGIGSVNFYTMFHKNQLRAAKFRNGHRHHDRVAEKRRASAQQTDSMHWLVAVTEAYARSFCLFMGGINSEDLFVCEGNEIDFVWKLETFSAVA